MKIMSSAVFAACLLAQPLAAHAAPRTIDDCEKIQAADAYNQCLASFGPVAHTHAVSVQDNAEPEPDAAPASALRRHYAHHHHHSHRHVSRHGHRSGYAEHKSGARQRMQFSVVSSGTQVR